MRYQYTQYQPRIIGGGGQAEIAEVDEQTDSSCITLSAVCPSASQSVSHPRRLHWYALLLYQYQMLCHQSIPAAIKTW